MSHSDPVPHIAGDTLSLSIAANAANTANAANAHAQDSGEIHESPDPLSSLVVHDEKLGGGDAVLHVVSDPIATPTRKKKNLLGSRYLTVLSFLFAFRFSQLAQANQVAILARIYCQINCRKLCNAKSILCRINACMPAM